MAGAGMVMMENNPALKKALDGVNMETIRDGIAVVQKLLQKTESNNVNNTNAAAH